MKVRKGFVVLAIVAVLSINFVTMGCETLYQKACNPSVEEKATVESYKAQATILLAFLRTQIPVPEVQAAMAGLQFAISVYDQVISGVCLAVEVVQNADKTVVANQTLARAKMKYRY